jgi:hypothetical protein
MTYPLIEDSEFRVQGSELKVQISYPPRQESGFSWARALCLFGPIWKYYLTTHPRRSAGTNNPKP